MRIRAIRYVLAVSTILGLALAASGTWVSPARAASTPTLNSAVQTRLCASAGNRFCGQTLTAMIPAGTAVTVKCDHGGDYYIVVVAHQNQEGYVPESDVTGAPSGLADCDTSAHQAIWAAAWAIGKLGQDFDPGLCLSFVVAAWRSAGVVLPGAYDPVDWLASGYAGRYQEVTSGSRLYTPPRGALVFWKGTNKDPAEDSEDGHVAISVGNGWVVSTEEEGTTIVHLLLIGNRNAAGYPYWGWVLP